MDVVKEKSPLVSVVVVTYNSSKTIIETLESIYNQTYNNIELIISDDSSKDLTVELCTDWIASKQDRFNNVQMLQVDKNTGVSANLNRAINKANGIWIKTLAGDDLLEPTCIDECVRFVAENKCKICMVKLHLFGGNEVRNRKHERSLEYYKYRFLKMDDRKKQYKRALYKHILPGPGIFFLKDLWKSINGFDEKYPNFEEYSFELKVLERERVFFLDKPLVKWRQRDGSLTHSIKSPAAKEDILFFKNIRKSLLKQHNQYFQLWDSIIFYFIIEKIEFEGKGKFYKILKLLSPIYYSGVFRRQLFWFSDRLSKSEE